MMRLKLFFKERRRKQHKNNVRKTKCYFQFKTNIEINLKWLEQI